MSQTLALDGLRVLVTRPAHQQANFTQHLQAAGAVPVSLPLLDILPTKDVERAKAQLQQARSADYVIFVSPNAVRFTAQLLDLPWRAKTAKFVAIGDATARSLLEYGAEADISPKAHYSSEMLLTEDEFQAVRGKNVFIISGDSGRTLLRDTLSERGADVETAVVYAARLPTYPKHELQRIFGKIRPQVICITSNQGILNLYSIVDEEYREQVLQTPLIVNSERCLKKARELGFVSSVTVAANPGDAGQLEGLQHWYSSTLFTNSE